MMRRVSLTVIALTIAAAGTANAQLPGLLKKTAKEVLKERLDRDKQKADEQRSRPPARKDKDRKYPPGLSFSTVLNGVSLLAKDGKFRVDNIQATFLPDDCKEGFTVLRTVDGEEIAQWDWKPDWLKKPYALLNMVGTTDLRSGQSQDGAWVALNAPGDYVLDFYLPTEHFYTFPFSVAKIGSDDPFGAGECYILKGAWQSWGYLFYEDAKPDRPLNWKVWLRNEGCDEKPIKARVEITRDQGGELVCMSRENVTHTVKPQWTRFAFDMVFPEGKAVPFGTYFKASDLLATDGAYTLTMKLDGQPSGTWEFAVEGGKLNYTGRTLRGKADPLTFVEGGRDAWWYAKEK